MLSTTLYVFEIINMYKNIIFPNIFLTNKIGILENYDFVCLKILLI